MRDRSGGRDGAEVTLEELVIAVERHRLQMAPLMTGLAGAIEDDASRELVGLLEDSDRELDRLCHRLGQHLRRLDEQQEGSSNGREDRRDTHRRWT